MLKKSHLVSNLFLYLCTALSLIVSITGFLGINSLEQLVYQVAYLPVTLSLLSVGLHRLLLKNPGGMKRILVYYNFIVVAAMVTAGWLAARSLPELVSAALFSPLAIYFLLQALPRRNYSIRLPKIQPNKAEVHSEVRPLTATPLTAKPFDFDRRAFLKLIGSAGVSVFVFSLFTKRAEAAFFGSVPGPGTVSLKDASGNKIDPAEKYPTDGYAITELDDSTPAYYGYVNKLGQWYITKEDSAGAYRYVKGSSGFTNATTGWPNRAALTYGYFDDIF